LVQSLKWFWTPLGQPIYLLAEAICLNCIYGARSRDIFGGFFIFIGFFTLLKRAIIFSRNNDRNNLGRRVNNNDCVHL